MNKKKYIYIKSKYCVTRAIHAFFDRPRFSTSIFCTYKVRFLNEWRKIIFLFVKQSKAPLRVSRHVIHTGKGIPCKLTVCTSCVHPPKRAALHSFFMLKNANGALSAEKHYRRRKKHDATHYRYIYIQIYVYVRIIGLCNVYK